MQYIHIKNLEKYHPTYKDRNLQWAKIYFKMVQGDPDCELIENEIDWGRFIKFILLELQAQQPIPLDEKYLTKKGFNLKIRPIQLTLNMLHNFVECDTQLSKVCGTDKDKEEDKDKEKEEDKECLSFEDVYLKYPNKVGRKVAQRHFEASVKSQEDWLAINLALTNYLQSERVKKGFIQNASTWFNNWRDWVVNPEPVNEAKQESDLRKKLGLEAK